MKNLYILLFLLMTGSMSAQLVLNETLYDPASGSAGDANGDGTRNATADEFIEFVNTSASDLDISGYKIFDSSALGNNVPRHVVPASTVISSGGVYLVFGGGTPTGTFGGATVHTSSTGSLGLTNGGDIITVKDASDAVIITFDSDGLFLNLSSDESVARTPHTTGPFRHHFFINGEKQTPGVLVSSIFTNTLPLILNEVHSDPDVALGDANGDGTSDIITDEFLEFYNNSGASVDISGYKIYDFRGFESGTPNHIVPASTVIPNGGVYLLFGGGTPTGTFGGAIVQTATTGNISLTNGGDTVFITNTNDDVVFVFDTPETGVNMGNNESATRSPELTGDFALHTGTTGGLRYSPGTQSDGSVFVLSNKAFKLLEASIYPNPVNNGFVKIELADSEKATIELFDLRGKRVLKKQLTSNTLDVRAVRSGLYLIKISTEDRLASFKIVIK